MSTTAALEQTDKNNPATSGPGHESNISIPNVDEPYTSTEEFYNTYSTKKTISHGILNGALLSSNGSQLKLLFTREGHDYLWIGSLSVVVLSIIGQIVLFILLAILSEAHVADRTRRRTLNIINDCVLALTGIIFALNIIANTLII